MQNSQDIFEASLLTCGLWNDPSRRQRMCGFDDECATVAAVCRCESGRRMEWKEWQCLPFKERNKLPFIPGIYVVADCNDNVWYVDQTVDLNYRWTGRAHHRYGHLTRSNGKRNFSIFWLPCAPRELDQTERYYINLFQPSLNTTKVKKYSPGKPQLKIETEHGYVYFRGKPEYYQEIAEYVGVFPCTPDDDKNVSIEKAQLVSRGHAMEIAIRYSVGSQSKTTKLVCSLHRLSAALGALRGKPYRVGKIVSIWRPRRVYRR